MHYGTIAEGPASVLLAEGHAPRRAQQKYKYWTGPKPTGADVDKWLAKAKEHPGSWWPDWLTWLKRQGGSERVPARHPGGGSLKPIEDAPGRYVKMRG